MMMKSDAIDDAIERYLDNTLEPSEQEALMASLTQAHWSELAAVRSALQVLEGLPHEPVSPRVVRNVMAVVLRPEPSSWSRLQSWFKRRPALGWQAAGFALAGWFLSVSVLPLLSNQTPHEALPGASVAAREGMTNPEQSIHLTLYSPDARSVALIGDFNGWGSKNEIRLTPAGDGLWSVSINLPTGQHQYAYLVDGRHWVADPRARHQLSDDFGRRNAVLTIL